VISNTYQSHARRLSAFIRSVVAAAVGLLVVVTAPVLASPLATQWVGTYYYANDSDSNTFSFELRVVGTTVSGRITEPATFGDGSSPWLYANVSGAISGSSIQFTKTYDGTGGVSHSATYAGEISPDGMRIAGTWSLPNLSGRFVMTPGTWATTPTPPPARPGLVGRAWAGRDASEVIGGRNFFAVAGVSEKFIRAQVRAALGDEIVFFPLRFIYSVTLEEYGPNRRRKAIDDYFVAFCATKQPTCKKPYTYRDGGVVVSYVEGREPRVFLHVHDARLSPKNKYCEIKGDRVICKINPPWFRDGKESVAVAELRGMIEGVKDGFETGRQPTGLTSSIATSGSAAQAPDLLKCIAYDSEQSYYVKVDKYGNEHGARDYNEPGYYIVNKCAFPIRVKVRLDSEGGCTARLTELFANFILGEERDYTLKTNQSGYLGACRGTITVLERK
jgi:hypothetical protein